jgi:hypothetical protein
VPLVITAGVFGASAANRRPPSKAGVSTMWLQNAGLSGCRSSSAACWHGSA